MILMSNRSHDCDEIFSSFNNIGNSMSRGGYRLGAGRKALPMDAQTRKYYNAYNMQRLHAGYRRIEWHFTFDTWLAWWGNDIINRGHGDGKLVMARYGDTGPYHPDNVRKATHNENASEHWRGKIVTTPAGEFASLTLAAKHFNVTVEAIRNRIKTRPLEYSYV